MENMVTFGSLEIGAKFFDVFSGDFFIKISETQGCCNNTITSADDAENIDEFAADELVELVD